MKKNKLTLAEQEQLENEILRREKALQNYLKGGHAMPRTRREFLSSGITAGLTAVALPSLLTLLSREAGAAELSSECKTLLDPVAGWTPYIQVILSGGAALHHNSLVLDKGRQLLPSYSSLGIGNLSAFSTRNEFGNVPLAVNSAGEFVGDLTREMFAQAKTAVDKTAMVKFCVRSLDDKPNRDGIMGLVNAVGQKGTLLPNVVLGNLTKAAYKGPMPVQRVFSQSGFANSLSPQGALKSAMAVPERRAAMLSLINKLSASQRSRLAGSASGGVLGQFVECATGKNILLADADATQLDPRKDAAVSSVWGLDSTTADDATALLQASVAWNVLKGYSGAGAILIGGYDYHGQTRADQNSKDAEGGRLIGRLLATAEALGKPLFIHVTSDGSVEGGGADGTGAQGADAGARGSGFFLVYNPNGRVELSDIQIGQFNSSQASDDTFISGWTAERCALAVFANYLQLHKKVGLLEQMVPGVFGPSDMTKILKIA